MREHRQASADIWRGAAFHRRFWRLDAQLAAWIEANGRVAC